ncbi:siderophore-interacting protein [Actinoplanes couchii]|uniref:Uncharacterized protein n=1 Tax=Actinoplanes couchii TaxID=403638 RepID=A0ABQ3XNF1_9ACTN|nr:siderophore-interacting protein [Actinoplanes couchii]MDR6318052.1 RNA polymerase sigma-70 factor (ECF subfamily) [Actinoplanes couchii]GID60031.1 hypothetical protein Aco03nite_084350 [Actinoplanes couchii]
MVRLFAAACARGDVAAAEALLLPTAAAVCDGFPIPVGFGPGEVARLAIFLLSGQPDSTLTVEQVNGTPGLVLRRGGRVVTIAAVTCADDRIAALWFVLAQEKLKFWNA